ncbi:MAG: universal stress protein [Betaproteobacteria bacterium]|nr:universal stress protein [Betaproteobacteria bacterium]
MYKHILIPTDGSELSQKAIEAGVEFARESQARVTAFTAVPEYPLPSEAELMSRRMASHGRRGLSALVHGSQTHGVLTHSTIPTLVYR